MYLAKKKSEGTKIKSNKEKQMTKAAFRFFPPGGTLSYYATAFD